MKTNIVVCCAAFMLSACGGGSSNSTPPDNTPPANVQPVATGQSLTLEEDNTLAIELSGTDSDGSIGSYEIVTQAMHGTLSGSANNLVYTPAADFYGEDVFTFQVIDDDGAASSAASVTLNVLPVNDAPVVQDSEDAQMLENSVSTNIFLNNLVSDVDSEVLEFALLGEEDSALFTIDASSSELVFLSAPDFETPSSAAETNEYRVAFSAIDEAGAEAEGTIVIEVLDESLLSLNVDYPTSGANLGGDATTVSVSGSIIDEEDGVVLPTDVSVINVNETEATIDLASATWASAIPVASTEMTISVGALVIEEVRAEANVSVSNSTLLYTLESPLGGILDEANNRILAVDASLNAVVSIDLTTGVVTEISGPSVGSGIALDMPRSLAYDSVRNTIFVADLTLDAVIKVNVADGSREIFIESNLLDTSERLTPNDVAFDIANDALYLTSNYDTVLEKIDPSTGARVAVTGANTGSGDNFSNIDAVTIDSANNVAYFTERAVDKIFRVNLTTGERTQIADGAAGSGEIYTDIFNMEISADGNTLYFVGRTSEAEPKSAVYAFNLITNDISIINDASTDGASDILYLQDIILSADNQAYWLLDSGAETVFHVDIAAGTTTNLATQDEDAALKEPTSALWDGVNERWFVADRNAIYVADKATETPALTVFSQDDYSYIQAIEFNEQANRLFVVDRLSNTRKVIVEVDTETGVGSVVVDSEEIGSNFYTNQLVYNRENDTLYWADYRYDEVVGYNLSTNRPFVVANASLGSGEALNYAVTATGDMGNGRLFVYDYSVRTVFSVDITSGNRVEIASEAKGEGVILDKVYTMVHDASNSRLILADAKQDLLVAVDIETGDRTVISESNATMPLYGSNGMSMDSETNNVFVADFNKESVYVIDLNSGERAILTR
ncbi:Ig-like domain-containing protein [Alteromonas gracilis]|uniref:Ig-like domain-containing protein n=1 Tax=Alteromonas gracilis TaxID=1479524 RepID=UPI003734E60D